MAIKEVTNIPNLADLGYDLPENIIKIVEVLQKEKVEALYVAKSNEYIVSYSVVAVFNSAKQIESVSLNLIKTLKESNLLAAQYKIDGSREREWYTIDVINCFVHIISSEKLEQFGLNQVLEDY